MLKFAKDYRALFFRFSLCTSVCMFCKDAREQSVPASICWFSGLIIKAIVY